MRKHRLIVSMLVIFIIATVFAIGASALGSDEDDGIHIDSAPAYACVGEGC